MPPGERRRGRRSYDVRWVMMKSRHRGATRMNTRRRGLRNIIQQSNMVNGREERKMEDKIQEVGERRRSRRWEKGERSVTMPLPPSSNNDNGKEEDYDDDNDNDNDNDYDKDKDKDKDKVKNEDKDKDVPCQQ